MHRKLIPTTSLSFFNRREMFLQLFKAPLYEKKGEEAISNLMCSTLDGKWVFYVESVDMEKDQYKYRIAGKAIDEYN